MASSSADSSGTAPALAGPFTLREVAVMAGALLLLVGSVLPFQVAGGSYANVWNHQTSAFNQFISLALPLIIGGAFAWRRLAGRTRVTAGSLTLDQLGSVVSLLGILYFFIYSVMSMNPAFLLGLVGALVMTAGTTAAPYIPGFVLDFAPGEAALLTRPIRPSAPRAQARPAASNTSAVPPEPATGAAAATGTTVPAGAQTPGQTPEEKHQAAVATGLAAGHSTTPEPVPGAWPVSADADEAAEPGEIADTTNGPTGQPAEPEATTPEPAGPPTDAGTLPVVAVSPSPSAGPELLGTPAAQEPAAETPAAKPDTAEDVPGPEASPASAAQAPAPAPAPAPETTVHSVAASSDTASQQEAEQSFTATSGGNASTSTAFWFAVPDSRTAVNEATGRNSFVLEPGEWILALEDRGYEFLVQTSDGAVGVLRDLSRIERA
ncbi:hypothetical protein ACTXK2_08685 [Arthrobacter rhombi]